MASSAVSPRAASGPAGWQQGLASAFSAQPSPAPIPPHMGVMHDPPTGSTPNAKRPLDPSTIPVATGADRVLGQADLSAGFANLVALQERDFKALMSTADAAHYNAQLLNAVVGRLNTPEASAALTATTVGTLTEDAKVTIKQLADHEEKADRALWEEMIKADRTLYVMSLMP